MENSGIANSQFQMNWIKNSMYHVDVWVSECFFLSLSLSSFSISAFHYGIIFRAIFLYFINENDGEWAKHEKLKGTKSGKNNIDEEEKRMKKKSYKLIYDDIKPLHSTIRPILHLNSLPCMFCALLYTTHQSFVFAIDVFLNCNFHTSGAWYVVFSFSFSFVRLSLALNVLMKNWKWKWKCVRFFPFYFLFFAKLVAT